MLKAAWFVLYTELLLHLRRSQEWLYPVGFFVVIISLFPMAFSPDPAFLQRYIAGCIWLAALFASVLSIQPMFYVDLEEGHLEQLRFSQLPFTLIILMKLIAQWLVTELPLILLTPLLGLLFHLSSATILMLCTSLLIGTPILTLIGSLGVALTVGLRQQGVLLGLIMLPLVTPVLIFGITITQQAQAGFSVLGPLMFLAGIALLAISLLPYVISSTLAIGLDA